MKCKKGRSNIKMHDVEFVCNEENSYDSKICMHICIKTEIKEISHRLWNIPQHEEGGIWIIWLLDVRIYTNNSFYHFPCTRNYSDAILKNFKLFTILLKFLSARIVIILYWDAHSIFCIILMENSNKYRWLITIYP